MLKYPIPLATLIFHCPIHVCTFDGRPFVVAKSLPGLDHAAKAVTNAICPKSGSPSSPNPSLYLPELDQCSSTDVGEAFHHTPYV
jgi:hypothetical protein